MSLYYRKTTQLSESRNASTLANDIRECTPFELGKNYLRDLCTKFASFQKEGGKFCYGQILKFGEEVLNYEKSKVRYYRVDPMNGYEFNVSLHDFVRNIKDGMQHVNTRTKRCSCHIFHQQKIPCRHILTALTHVTRNNVGCDVMSDDCVDPKYFSDSYKAAFLISKITIPRDDDVTMDESVLPPPKYRQKMNDCIVVDNAKPTSG